MNAREIPVALFSFFAIAWCMALTTDCPAALIITDDGTNAPTGALIENTGNTSNTRVNDAAADAPRTRIRGQSFTTTSALNVNAVTLQLRLDNAGNSAPTSGSNPMRLLIWEIGSSVAPSDGTLLLDDSGDFPLNMDAGDYFTLNLDSSISLDATTQYGFSIEWANSLGNDIFPAQLGGFDGGELLFNQSAVTDVEVNAANGGQDLTFYIQGMVVPEPASLALLAFGGLLLFHRRT